MSLFFCQTYKNLKLPPKVLNLNFNHAKFRLIFTLLQQFCYFLKIKLTDFASIFCSNWNKNLKFPAKGRHKEIIRFLKGGRGSE